MMLALGQHGSHHAVDVTAFFSGGGVGIDIGQAEGVDIRAPGKGDLGEILGDFLHGGAVLRTVGDDDVKALAGIVADGGRRIRNLEHVLGVLDLHGGFAAHLLLDGGQGAPHRLAEGHIGDGAGHDDRDADGFRRRRGGCGGAGAQQQGGDQCKLHYNE